MYMHILALFLVAAVAHVTPRQLPIQSSAAVAQFRAVESCGLMDAPETTNSPHPMLSGSNHAVVVDFLVGYDGLVYSPFVLESSDELSSREALRLVKTWRFHPATCNRIPINAEGRVTFFSR